MIDKRYNSIFEFRMSGEPHLWQGSIDIREISIDEYTRTVLIKIDGTNNKNHKREQIQLHFSQYHFEELIAAVNQIIPKYKQLTEEWNKK